MTRLIKTICVPHGVILFFALTGLLIQGCGSGSTTPPSDADPTGYYDVNGTASVNGTPPITDLQAIVNGTRIMMMSVANGLLYDGTITDITLNSFTADFTIYTNGQSPMAAAVSGTITQGSRIEGTLTGSGAGNGTFSLSYATTNNQVAALSRIENTTNVTWGAVIGNGTSAFEFIIDAAGVIVDDANNVGGLFQACEINFGSTLSPISGTNLYAISSSLVSCADTNVRMNYTGFATTQSIADTTLVFMMTSGTYSFNGDFQ